MAVRSLRFRMMLLFCALVGVLLAGSYLAFYALLSRQLRVQIDRELLGAARPVIADLVTDLAEEDVNQLDLPGEYFEVLNASGRVLQRSKNLADRPLEIGPMPPEGSETVFRTLGNAGPLRLRLALIPFRRGSETLFLALAMPTRSYVEDLRTFRQVALFLLPFSLLLTAVISAWYVGKSLAPVSALTERAARMAERISDSDQGDLWPPLVVANPHDELGHLAETFNRLFARVASALRQLRQFVSDASHELRTPLSILQGETELLLAEPRTPGEYQEALRVIEDELKKLSRIVESLFTLAMADAGQLRLAREPIYLNEVLEEACAMAEPRGRAKGISIERSLAQEISCLGDEASLHQLFLIFLDNAIKYSPSGTQVRVSLQAADGVVRISFRDQGIGIPRQHLPHIFERFYRGAEVEGSEARSGGLGLAIAQAIVQAEGGSIECQSEPGDGSTFTINLPKED